MGTWEVAVDQSLSPVQLLWPPWTAAHQAPLSSTILPEFAQTYVHQVGDAIQPSHPLSPPSPALSLFQHQGLFQWVCSLHQVAKVSELQHQSFKWVFRVKLSHESGDPMMELVPLEKGRETETFFSWPHEETTPRRWQSSVNQEEDSPGTWPFWHPDLGIPASRTVRNKCLLFMPPSLWYYVISALSQHPLGLTNGRCPNVY